MTLILETPNFILESADQPHITRSDGGHLRISPKVPIKDRTELTPRQAIELIRLTMLSGEAMAKGLKNQGIELGRINYQDNGNWRPFFHVHLYGRALNAKIQPYGHATHFPFPETGFYDHNEVLNEEDIEEIKKQVEQLATTEKYLEKTWGLG